MLIALLALLGVDLVVVAALAALVLGRKRWVRRQPGAFAGAIRAADSERQPPRAGRAAGAPRSSAGPFARADRDASRRKAPGSTRQ